MMQLTACACLQFVRETNNGSGMGFHLTAIGKVTIHKVLKVASSLFTVLVFLAQLLAPAELAWQAEISHIRWEVDHIHEIRADVALLKSTCSGP